MFCVMQVPAVDVDVYANVHFLRIAGSSCHRLPNRSCTQPPPGGPRTTFLGLELKS